MSSTHHQKLPRVKHLNNVTILGPKLEPIIVIVQKMFFTIYLMVSGGDGGIRTHDRVTPIHTFQACAFDHSATSPHSPWGRTPLAAPLRFRKAQ